MNVRQRQIVEVPFNLPEKVLNHPVIVLSCNSAIDSEDHSFVGVMLTSSKQIDEFTFEITDHMLTKKLSKGFCQARIHLISFFRSSDIIQNSNQNVFIKQDYFDNLIEQIINITFARD